LKKRNTYSEPTAEEIRKITKSYVCKLSGRYTLHVLIKHPTNPEKNLIGTPYVIDGQSRLVTKKKELQKSWTSIVAEWLNEDQTNTDRIYINGAEQFMNDMKSVLIIGKQYKKEDKLK